MKLNQRYINWILVVIFLFFLPAFSFGDTCLMGDCEGGIGVVVFEDGTKYTGPFENGIPNGRGTFDYPEGKRIKADKNLKVGDKTFTRGLPMGKKYVGRVKNGVREGLGDLTFESGARYVGDFKNNMFNGKGIMENPNGIKYEGDFQDGQPHGQGKIYFPDGKIYSGDVQKNQISGKGTMTYPDGQIETGVFENGKFLSAIEGENKDN